MEKRNQNLRSGKGASLLGESTMDTLQVEIEKLMRQARKTLKDYPDIELRNAIELEQLGNRMINEELSYDMEALKNEHKTIISNVNHG